MDKRPTTHPTTLACRAAVMAAALAFFLPAFAQGAWAQPPAAKDATAKSPLARALVGTWSVTRYAQFDVAMGKSSYPIGDHPLGYMQFSPGGHVAVFITASKRIVPKPPFTEHDLATIERELGSAYVGTYRLEGDKLTVREYTAVRAEKVGTDNIRYVTITGDHLEMKNAPSINGKTGRNTITEISADRLE